ncbi:MAG: hypothetical protein GX837_11300 [Methanomicrobiales archaeon]|nr:hypothetical protein [Methanomicrobiales archaeon]
MKVDFIFKAFAAIFSVIVVLFLLFAFTETVLPDNSYTVEITGLPGPAANGTATVMVPIPANVTGEPVIPEEALVGDRVAGWQAAVRETPYGKMLAFTATEGYAPDVSVSFEVLQTEDESQRLPRYQRPTNLTAWEMKREPRLLMPVLATPDNVSVAEFIRVSNGTYTTVVFLDGFAPPPEDAAGITFSLEYRGVGGTKRLIRENTWTTTVNAVVQGTESDFVLVTAEYRVIAGGIGF